MIRPHMAVDPSTISCVDAEPGELPATLAARVIREERYGEPNLARPTCSKTMSGASPRTSFTRRANSRDTRKRARASAGVSVPVRIMFPTSVYTVRPFGKVVIGAGTTGLNLDFDVRHPWMKQEILGSHFANAYECLKASELIESGAVRPVLWRTLGFDGVGEAHQLMKDNKHLEIAVLVGAEGPGLGRTADGPGAIHAEVGA